MRALADIAKQLGYNRDDRIHTTQEREFDGGL